MIYISLIMLTEYNIISIPVLICSLIIFSLVIELRKFRSTPGINSIVFCLLFSALYTLFYGFEILTIGLPISRVFNYFAFVAYPLIPPLFFRFVYQFTGFRSKGSYYLHLVFFAIAVVYIFLSLTNNYHGLVYSYQQIKQQSGFLIPNSVPLIGMWIYHIIIIIIFLVSLVFLLRYWKSNEGIMRNRTIFLIISSLIPFIIFLFHLMGVRLWGLEILPFAFALMAIVVFIGIGRYSVLGVAPVVRNILFEKLPDAVLVVDNENNLIDYNSAASELFGLHGHFKGVSFEKALKNFPQILSVVLQIPSEDGTLVEIPHQQSARFISLYQTELSAQRGLPAGKMIIARDVTREIVAEKQRRELEEKFRLIVENAPLGIFYYDQDGIIRVCNDQFVQIMGSSRELLIGLNLYELPDKRVSELVQKTMQGEKAFFQGHYTSYTGNKTTPLRALFDGIRDDNGTIVGGIGILEDMTGYLLIEEELRNKNAMLEQMIAERDRFFSIIAHDLRSPFSSFLGLTELMTGDEYNTSTDEIKKYAHEIRNRAIYLFELLENLLEWSRLQRNHAMVEKRDFSLVAIVDKSLETIKDIATRKDILITLDIPDKTEVFVNERMIQSLFRNLFSNAIKFTPRGGLVDIRARAIDHEIVEIRVADTGIGISPEVQSHLFQLDFNNPTRGTDGEPSSGLGLILCKEYVEKNNGTIKIESKPGSGTVVIITLPGRVSA